MSAACIVLTMREELAPRGRLCHTPTAAARARANSVTIEEVGVSGRRLLEPARAASLFETPSRNLGEPVKNRPFTLLLGSASCGNRPVRRANHFTGPFWSLQVDTKTTKTGGTRPDASAMNPTTIRPPIGTVGAASDATVTLVVPLGHTMETPQRLAARSKWMLCDVEMNDPPREGQTLGSTDAFVVALR